MEVKKHGVMHGDNPVWFLLLPALFVNWILRVYRYKERSAGKPFNKCCMGTHMYMYMYITISFPINLWYYSTTHSCFTAGESSISADGIFVHVLSFLIVGVSVDWMLLVSHPPQYNLNLTCI